MNIHKNAKTTPKMRALIVARRQAGESRIGSPMRLGFRSPRGTHGSPATRWRGRRGWRTAPAALTGFRPARRTCNGARWRPWRSARQPFWKIAASAGLARATVARTHKSCRLSHLSAFDPRPEVIRYEKDTPGEMIHIDIKKLGRTCGTRHRIPPSRRLQAIACRAMGDRTGQSNPRARKGGGKGGEYLHLATGDPSRLAYSEIFPDETRKSCLRFLFNALRFFRSHGVKVWRGMTPSRQIAAQSPARQWTMVSTSGPSATPRH